MAREIDPGHDIRPLVRRLSKPPSEWRRRDLVALCLDDGIRVLNFRYASLDGKLRELRLPVTDPGRLDRVLAAGERVDGSSLFPGLFPTGSSDLYAVPVYRRAFLDPFAPDELNLLCRFAGPDGEPSPLTPDNLLADVADGLRVATGLDLLGLAEVEFYLVLDRPDARFAGKTQRSYHQSAPYLHGRPIVDEMLRRAAEILGRVKYAHSEVGYIERLESDEPELDGKRVEQHELELDLLPVEDLGAWLPVVRWLVRAVADRHGASVTFVPKLDEGMAGSGLHHHLALERQGVNIVERQDGGLSEEALAMIGGLLAHADSLTAFGNTVAASYLRLVPGQEAPTRIGWGERNRSSLIRVPLSFRTEGRLDRVFNPGEDGAYPDDLARPTVEYRSPDGSAFVQLLLAAVTLAVRDGLEDAGAAVRARSLEVDGDAAQAERLELLPATAVEAAERLRADRGFYERGGFAPRLLDLVVEKLESEADLGLSARLRSLPAAERLAASRRLMHKDVHKN